VAISVVINHRSFHILAESGEDQLLVADQSDFAANAEVCPAIDAQPILKKETALKDKRGILHS